MSRTTLSTTVAAGPATVVVGARAAALVDVDADDSRADPLLAAIEAGGGREEILHALAEMGFDDLPSFGIVVDEERGLRAFARGSVRLRVTTETELDQSALSASNLLTWREVAVPAARTWELHLTEHRPDALVPLDRGIVDAVRIVGEVADLDATIDPPIDEEPAEDPEPVAEPEPEAPPMPPPDDATLVDPRPPLDPDAGPIPTPAPPTGPTVEAVLCPDGHPSPPGDRFCIRCETEIDDPTIHTVDRPAVAVLLWDTGRSVEVDRPIVAGRNPKAGTVVDGEEATVFRVADPDAVLSREHVEIRSSGWDVLVSDLHSRNGTTLTRPGSGPERLEPGVSVVAPMGTEVVLAESAVFRVDPPY